MTRKVAPRPSSLSTAIVPPCASTIAWLIASPRPVPWIACLRRLGRPEELLEEMGLRSLRDPDARVRDLDHDLAVFLASPSARRARRRGVNFSAFETRLSSS